MASGSQNMTTYRTSILQGAKRSTDAGVTTPAIIAGEVYYAYNVNNDIPGFNTSNNANGILTLNTHAGNYYHQLGFSSDGHVYHHSFSNAALATSGWVRLVKENGTSSTWAISISGNAATADKWKTTRTLTIGATGKNVDGSGNVSWSKNEILGASTNAYFLRGDKEWSNTLNGAFTANGTITANGGYLKSTANSNTVTIGSQNTSYTHIYNSANIPFIFNNTVESTNGDLGTSSYPWHNIYIGPSNGAGIYYKGTKSTYRMIRFIDNASDEYGNGISIGGGGQTIIGGGESASTAAAQVGTAGSEVMYVCNDGNVDIISNLQNGWDNRKIMTFNTSGYLMLPSYINVPTNNNENPTVSQFIVTNGSDHYYRKASTAHAMAAIRGVASGSWGISVTGSSASCTGNSATTSKLLDSAHSWTATEVYNYMTARVLKAGDTMSGDLLFSNSGTTTRQVRGIVGDNDYWRIAGGATAANAGWMEIATADDGNEPVYVRQYTGAYTTIKRTLTLLDASGDSSFPGIITATRFVASSGQPGLTVNVSAGNWSYVRLHNGSHLWDIATKSNTNDGALDFRPGGGDSGPRINRSGRWITQLTPSSWIDGQRYTNAAYNIADYSNTGSYNPWIRATNTWSSGAENAKVGRWFSFGTLGTRFYWIGSTTTKTDNSYEHGMTYDISNGVLTSTRMDCSWLRVVNDSSNNSDDATVYIQSQTSSDWALKIVKGGKNYGIRVDSLDQSEAIWTNGHVRGRAIWANQGSNGERDVGVDSSTSGNLYLYAHTTGKGLYSNSGYQTGAVITISSSEKRFFGNVTGNVTGNCSGSSGSCTGNAATATNADKVDNYHAADLWRKDGATWNGNANVNCTATANGQEWSIDLNAGSYTGTYWHVWSTKNSASILQCYTDNRHVIIPVHLAVGGYNNTSYALSTNSFICNSWVRTKGSTGWYNEDYSGGWYMVDNKWNRSYGSKPVLIDIGTNNSYGIGGHRLALGLSGGSHTSILLKGGDVMYGFCVNNDGNWYFGRRTSKSFEDRTGDAYLLYGNSTTFYPSTDNSINLGASSQRWKTCYAVNFYGYLNGNISGSSASCTGNAATATKLGTANKGSSNHPIYLSGGTPTECHYPVSGAWYSAVPFIHSDGMMEIGRYIDFHGTSNMTGDHTIRLTCATNTARIDCNGIFAATGWSDLAEYRRTIEHEPGRAVIPTDCGIAKRATKRLQPGARIVSDTYGFCLGESDDEQSPIALTGRVLAYPCRPISEYHAGDAVCSGPNGTVDLMTREEIQKYPDCIIGIVNEIPTYPIWNPKHTDDRQKVVFNENVEVRGRIWIDVK